MPRPIELRVFDLDLTAGAADTLDAHVDLQCLRGGVPRDRNNPGVDDEYTWYVPPLETAASIDGEMSYSVEFVDPGAGIRKYTRFLLYNTPVVAPIVEGPPGEFRGLANTRRARLYGLEYNPAPTMGSDFDAADLTSSGDHPKNTARWRLRLGPDLFATARFVDTDSPPNYVDPLTTSEPDRVVAFQTSIYDPVPRDLVTGAARPDTDIGSFPNGTVDFWCQPENRSETYCWWADSPDDVPMVERSQFLGDPRHNPYKDLLDGDPDFPNRYNWYHDDLTSSTFGDARSDFPSLPRVADRWHEVRADVPRFFEVLRTALAGCNAIYTTLTGYSYYYIGIGNEIGYDSANGYPSSIPVNQRPWSGTSTNGTVNNITGRRCFVRNNPATAHWIGLPWLGELYPDEAYPVWSFIDSGDLHPGVT